MSKCCVNLNINMRNGIQSIMSLYLVNTGFVIVTKSEKYKFQNYPNTQLYINSHPNLRLVFQQIMSIFPLFQLSNFNITNFASFYIFFYSYECIYFQHFTTPFFTEFIYSYPFADLNHFIFSYIKVIQYCDNKLGQSIKIICLFHLIIYNYINYNSIFIYYYIQFQSNLHLFYYYNIFMSKRGISQSKGQVQRRQRNDPFSQISQMMMGFGSMRNDPFFGGAMMGFGEDPFNDIFKFSDVHKNMHSKGAQGSFVCQSFVSSSKMGPDGKIVRQDYFQNSMGQHRKGNTISQKQQAYKNSSGVNRIAEQRMLNDRGRKIVRQKNGNDIEETNHYYNIDEQQASKFDSDWRNADKQMKFIQNHQRYLQQLGNQPRQMQLGYQRASRQPERQLRDRQGFNNLERQQRGQRQPQLEHKTNSTVSGSRGSKRSQASKYSNAVSNKRY